MTFKRDCDYCGKQLKNNICGLSTTDPDGIPLYLEYHGDKRACRVAAHEYPEATWIPPDRSDQMDTRDFGAALTGFDYIRWPWWLRWIPQSWLHGLRGEVATKVGGSVGCSRARREAGGNDD